MPPDRLLGYVVMLLASSLFVFIGSMLLFAPAKFSKWLTWWAKQLHFPQSSDEQTSDTRPRKRVPGFALACFGGFILFKVARSLHREISIPLAATRTEPAAQHGVNSPLQYVAVVFPILLGLLLLIGTDAILNRYHNAPLAGQPDGQGLRYAKYLFKAIGLAASLAGIIGLVRMLL
jgi:hypothetical protein